MSTYYVSPTGGTGAGSEGDPWSLNHARTGAAGVLAPGDLVLVRGGTYSSQTGYAFTVSGAAGNPITFRNYPGETWIIDGAIPAASITWELCTGTGVMPGSTTDTTGKNIWRTTTAVIPVSNDAGGNILVAGIWMPLITQRQAIPGLATDFDYADLPGNHALGALAATSQEYHKGNVPGDRYYYVGPGVAEESTDGKIYIRLVAPDPAVHYGPGNGGGLAGLGTKAMNWVDNGTDPNNYSIKLWGSQRYGITVTGSYLTFDGPVINDIYSLVSIGLVNGTTLRNISGRFGQIAIRTGSSNDTIIEYCTLDGELHPERSWMTWVDTKGGYTNTDSTRKAGIGDSPTNLKIRYCTIANVFDGMSFGGGHDIEVYENDFINCWDDAWQMYSNLYRVNLHHNRFLGAGPSHDNSGGASANLDPGTVYLHHNIIDTSVQLLEWCRLLGAGQAADVVGWYAMLAHSIHGYSGPAGNNRWSHPWKYYYNTLKTGAPAPSSTPITLTLFNNVYADNHHAAPHEVHNNIFVHQGNFGRDMEVDTGHEIFDGNVYARLDSGVLFSFVHTSIRAMNSNALQGTIAKIRATEALADSQVYYAPGYENSGLTVAPNTIGLDASYRPSLVSVHTGAVNLTAKGWPGTALYEPWRGAVNVGVVYGTASGPLGDLVGTASEFKPNPAGRLLLESGDRMLLEDGDLLLLEPPGNLFLLESGSGLLLESGDRMMLESGVGSEVVGAALSHLGALDGTIAGERGTTGVAVSNLGGLVGTADGKTLNVSGVAVIDLGALTGTVTGDRSVVGTAAVAFGGLSDAVVGTREVYAAVLGPLGGLSGAATGARSISGSAVGDLGAFAGAVQGVRNVAGTAAVSLGGLSGTVQASTEKVGVASAAFGALLATIAGQRGVAGTSNIDLGALSGSVAAARSVTGAAPGPLGALDGTAAGQVSHPGIGSISSPLGAMTGTVQGGVGHTGAALAVFGFVGSLVGDSSSAIAGTATAVLSAIVGTASGQTVPATTDGYVCLTETAPSVRLTIDSEC